MLSFNRNFEHLSYLPSTKCPDNLYETMESSERRERRSERKRKRKESYSPDGKKDENVVKKSRCKSRANRLYDILPNGEPFSCHLCKSPYVVNTLIKTSKKAGRSSHTPLPKVRIDKNTGKEIMLCNACVQIYDRPPRRTTVKPICVPSEEEKKAYLDEIEHFVKILKSQCDDPLVERLFCPVSQKKLCGCLQKCINSSGESSTEIVHKLTSLIKEAVELRKEKAYPVPSENKKHRVIGLGNGHKKSKKYESFVITKRQYLREELHLCERATQKILMYSNNFLHKRLKTENRPCRIERTRGKAALGKLPEFHKMMDLHCCMDNCVMLALTHKRLLQDWRSRAQQGQSEARRVVAEMLTPAGALHTNCYSFISMVSGCCQATISSVYNQMIDTGGVRDPPEHGMKRVWQEHYKRHKTSTEGNQNVTSDNVSSDISRQRGDSPCSTVTSETSTINTLETAARHNKLLWMQHFAKNQLQQQLAQQLQELVNRQKILAKQTPESQTVQQTPTNTTSSPPAASHTLQPCGQGQQILCQGQSPVVYDQQQSNTDQQLMSQGLQQLGQGRNSQGHIQQIVLQPPPQYGMTQTGMEKPLQYTFHIDLNQPNYVVTGDQQLVPVIPVFKYQGQPQVHQGIDPSMQQTAPSQPQPSVIFAGQHMANASQISQLQSQEILTQSSRNVHRSNDVRFQVDSNNSIQEPQAGISSMREYQIMTNEGVVVFQAPVNDANTINMNNGSFINVNPSAAEHAVYVAEARDESNNVAEKRIVNVVPCAEMQGTKQPIIRIPDITIGKATNMNRSENSVNVSASVLPDKGIRNSEAIVSQLSSVQNLHLTNSRQKRNYEDETLYKIVKTNHNSTAEMYGNDVENLPTALVTPSSAGIANNNLVHSENVQTMNCHSTVTPVSYVPVLDSNSEQNEDLPSQIQISFKTCSSNGDQIGYSQQIVMPHSSVVTLPLIPMTCAETAGGQSSATYEIANDQLVKPHDNAISRQMDTSDSRKGKLYNITGDENGLEKQESQLPRLKVVRSRNVSGRKSRHSSGSLEKSKRVLDHSQESYLDVRSDHFNDGHFMSKLDKIRLRQMSGNSDHEDRSRKSSGNSMSDSSSHASGLTLSNLASPNIFHDKDKGIFFMQSLEFSEIDSGHVADFIQAVESDNAVNILRHQMEETGTMLHDHCVVENS